MWYMVYVVRIRILRDVGETCYPGLSIVKSSTLCGIRGE